MGGIHGGSTPDLTIGVIGPHELVERVMLMGTGSTAVPSRLVAAAYRDEHEAADKVLRLGSGVDACLFASPLPHEGARRAGVLDVPATSIPPGGAALESAVLRAAVDGRFDPTRASVDVVSRAEVEEVYADAELSPANVYVCEETAQPGPIAGFHERLWRSNTTTVALTGVHGAAQRLEAAGVPTLRMRPTGALIRSALQTAALLGAHHRSEEAQLAVVLVDASTLRETSHQVSGRYWRDELRLTLHRVLLQEAHRMSAAVWPVDDHSYLVAATRGTISAVTDGFRRRPFVDRVSDELGLTLDVGVGMGRTTHDAEAHARTALARSKGTSKGTGQEKGAAHDGGFVVDGHGRVLVPAPRGEPPTEQQRDTPHTTPRGTPHNEQGKGAASKERPKGLDILERLARRLEGGGRQVVVDAETAGELLDVTPRTARRLLRTLVEDGLAWPLPADRGPQPGRPRQLYRIIVERLPAG